VALGFAQPLVDGIMSLVGAKSTKLVMRLHDQFGGGKALSAGYLVIANAPAGELKKEQLWVNNDRLHHGPERQSATNLTGYDYALIRIDVVAERDDYHALSSIDEPYKSAVAALGEAMQQFDEAKQKEKLLEAERLLMAAKIAAFKAKELTVKVGRRQVIQALQASFDEAKQLLAPGAADQERVSRTLEQAMKQAMPASEALIAGEITASELS
jgi:hypothetical protein